MSQQTITDYPPHSYVPMGGLGICDTCAEDADHPLHVAAPPEAEAATPPVERLDARAVIKQIRALATMAELRKFIEDNNFQNLNDGEPDPRFTEEEQEIVNRELDNAGERVLAAPVAEDTGPVPAVNEDSLPAAEKHKRLAHEVDLTAAVISHLESEGYRLKPSDLEKSEGYAMRTDVECQAGVADIVTGDAVYSIACSLARDTLPDVALKLEALVEEIDRTADGIIITCCSDEVESLDAQAGSYGLRVQTFEQFIAPPEKLPVKETAQEKEVSVPAGEKLFAEPEAGVVSHVLVQQILPSRLSSHPSLLMRANGLDQDHVRELEQGYRAGQTFPPADVFYDGEHHWVADGNHRAAGAAKAGAPLDVIIHKGTLRDAILFALRANMEHGLKLTNDDKRLKAVTILCDPEWFTESDTRLAELARVTQPFISGIRRDLAQLLPSLSNDESQLSNEDVAKRLGVSAGLVRIVRELPDDVLDALTQNVLSDDGRRRGADNILRSVPGKAAAEKAEAPTLPLEVPEQETAAALVEDAPPARPNESLPPATAVEAEAPGGVIPAEQPVEAQTGAETSANAQETETFPSSTSPVQETAPLEAPAPVSSSPEVEEAWGKATVVVTLKLMPDDGHIEGRRVLIVTHEEGGSPITNLTRARDLFPATGPLRESIDKLREEIPARLSKPKTTAPAKPETSTPLAKANSAPATKKSAAKKPAAQKPSVSSAKKPAAKKSSTRKAGAK